MTTAASNLADDIADMLAIGCSPVSAAPKIKFVHRALTGTREQVAS